ncbi:hypothetical protein KCU62_g106, partial [Aureobasidium sp. EXF-3399]
MVTGVANVVAARVIEAVDAIEDSIELTLPDASEATAAGSVRIEDAVSRDEMAAVFELPPVTPLRASEIWKPRLVGNAVA